MKLLHLSDIHFGTHQPPLVEVLLAKVHEIAPDVIVVSGDLTQQGTRRQFKEARDFLLRLPGPLVVIPGNHDVPGFNNAIQRLADPFRRYNRVIAPGFESSFEDPGFARIHGMNSVRPFGWYADWSRGHLDDSQLEELARQFPPIPETTRDEEKDRPLRIVTLHHPLLHPPDTPEFFRRMVDRRPETLAAFGRAHIDIVLSGHYHLAYSATLPCSDEWSTLAVHAASGLSHRSKGHPNGFNLLHLQSQAVEVEAFRWEEEAKVFASDFSEFYARQKHGWAFLEKKAKVPADSLR